MSDEEMNDELPKLPAGFAHMVAPYEFRLCGHGQILRFTPGVPLPVKSANQADAMARGAKMVEGQGTPKSEPLADPKKDPSSPEYRGLVRAAAESILARNDPNDFGGNGFPYVKTWETELKFRPNEQVREEIWISVKEELAAGARA